MKRNIIYGIVVLVACIGAACQEDEQVQIATVDIENAEISASYTHADIQWKVSSESTISEVYVEYSTDSAFSEYKEAVMTKVEKKENQYTISLDSLADGQKYYLRCRAVNRISSYVSGLSSFTTLAYSPAVVQTDSVDNVSVSSAQMHATLLKWGSETLPSAGFYFALHEGVTEKDSCINCRLNGKTDTIPYSYTLTELADNTTYYVRAFALNNKGLTLGEELSFTTVEIVVPTMGETNVSTITYTTAVCISEIVSDGGSEVTERGICYSENKTPTIANHKVAGGSGTGSFTCNLSDLTDGTTYYVRAYAINSKGTSYGEQIEFTTPEYGKPVVTTAEVTNITYTSATCGGNVIEDGDQTVIERGICYATTTNPTIKNNKVTSGSDKGSFTCNLTNLTDGTTYYVRAYATNSKGISYGDQVEFETTEYKAPTVTTSNVTNISYTTATCGGNVTSDGNLTVTERGVCYATTKNPTIDDYKVTSDSGTGSYTCNLSGLTDGTTYYVRAYATNSKGTSYGDQVEFKTKEYGLPTVTTSNVTNISYTTATCGGNVTSDGNLTVTERGVCYATTKNPTIADNKVMSSSSGTGAYTCDLVNLIDGTTYYVRAYATNGKGTSYGNEISFATTVPPSIHYTSDQKLVETTSLSSPGLHTNAFGGVTIASHTFENGHGTIIFKASITHIGNYAFYNCSGLTSVTIPNSVTSIGDYAFHGCSSLTSVTIGNSVTSIGSKAFSNCSSLTSVTIPNSVTSIGDYAFFDCTGLTSVTIGNSVTSIGDYAFEGCSGLTSVTIPNSVTSSGNHAFSGCSALTSVTIGNSVTSIGEWAFSGCSALTSVTIPNSVTSIGDHAFSSCSSLTSVTIGNSVTSIGNYAFGWCYGLTSVTIPNSVTSIGKGAFLYCSGLTSVTIPNSVTSIGEDAFRNVPNIVYFGDATGSPWGAENVNAYVDGYLVYSDNTMTTLRSCSADAQGEIIIPNSVTSIGNGAFSGCSGLTSVTIPNSVTSIGSRAFERCTGLTSVMIGNSVTSIGDYAFSNCSSLTSVTIPSSVTNIGDGAFYKCSGLTTIDVAADNPNYCSEGGVLFNKDKTTLVAYPGARQGAYAIPISITRIGNWAFYGCSGLTSVTIPNSVTIIGEWAFSNCSGLTSVTIPNSVTSIRYYAFSDCSSLTSVMIGNSVTSIGSYAFSGCSGLTSITCEAGNPPTCYTNSFNNVKKSIPLYVPAASISTYQTANVWKDFTNILPISE